MPRAKKDAPVNGDPSGLRAAGAKLEADEKAKKRAPKMQLGFTTRDTLEERQEIELACPMSPSELTHAGAENAKTQGAIDDLTAAMALKASDFRKERKTDKAELETLKEDHVKGSREVREMARQRLVPVRVEHDFGLGASRYHRLDQGTEGVGLLYDTTPMDPELREELRNRAEKLKAKAEPVPVIEAPAEASS